MYNHHFFSMFVNCLSERIRHSKFNIYADDLQIYLSGSRSDLNGLIARVNEDLEAIHRWSIEIGLLLNPDKSQVSNTTPELPLPLLFLGDIALECKDVVTDLGLLIDCRLQFGRHVTNTCSAWIATSEVLDAEKRPIEAATFFLYFVLF
jgi:hypothetical protein